MKNINLEKNIIEAMKTVPSRLLSLKSKLLEEMQKQIQALCCTEEVDIQSCMSIFFLNELQK